VKQDTRVKILIFAEYEEIGALMATLVELSGYTPVAARADESAADAVRRLAPAVVLLDWDHELAGSVRLRDALEVVGCTTLLFSSARSTEELTLVAGRCGLAAITFPLERAHFSRSLRTAVCTSRCA
jgi:DNA-binding response OmpR family regulator